MFVHSQVGLFLYTFVNGLRKSKKDNLKTNVGHTDEQLDFRETTSLPEPT